MTAPAPRSSRVPAVLAFDVGTTETKTGLVGLDGALLGSARAGYAIDVDPATGRAEQDPESWWRALGATARALALEERAEVVAICVDGHGPTTTAVDADGRPTRAALTWLDSRSAAEAEDLGAATGLRGWGLGVLPGALWVERHDATAAARTRWYLNTWEALALRLSGEAATSLVEGHVVPSDAAIASAGLPAAKIARPIPAGSVVGRLTETAGHALGLPPGIPVIAGLVDAYASIHGAGLLAPGDAVDVGGGAGGFGVYWGTHIEAAGSFCADGPLPGLHMVGGAMAATGKALDWFRDGILGGTVTTEALLTEAAAVAPGSDGVLFLPYLAGERAPIWDPTARGAFAGLSLNHGRPHLVRAILEAAAFAIRHVAEPILAAGVTVTSMRLAGGPARSEAWNQLKADITGFPVEIPAVTETAVVGSAILGAVGIGAYPDLRTAIAGMTRIERRLDPRPEHVATYDRAYAAYRALYPALAGALAGHERATAPGELRGEG